MRLENYMYVFIFDLFLSFNKLFVTDSFSLILLVFKKCMFFFANYSNTVTAKEKIKIKCISKLFPIMVFINFPRITDTHFPFFKNIRFYCVPACSLCIE